ncbi:HNH endonuclease [Bosea sp. (in: a-proteobacteria)]|uniref:HNH endonuclease n=1 Tax=Bosea sp. (in: a-proteobacteria) TaxID=1871050 RepID=UPI0026374BBD|nr:HNH endonuclease [Bosea sp. (in: a-proteobacteria)]MCO5092661.1 HNH endonuclease [Bosea sp. (in: a-proteobacteria)]
METLRDFSRYLLFDRENGHFFWRPREGDDRITKGWNVKFAGKRADRPMKIGYRRVRLLGTDYLAHRLAWLFYTGEMPRTEIDHVDGDRARNVKINLRCASRTEQSRNTVVSSRNKCGVKGVCFATREKKWVARVHIARKPVFIGYFRTLEAAAEAYRVNAAKHFGAFARAA